MTGGEASEAREALVRQALFVFIAVLLPFGVAFAPNIFNDGDVSWHVATGQWIAAHREIPTTDPFSLTAAGQPWVAMEWPADLMFAGAYALAGLAGLATLFAAALMALHVVIFVHLQRRTSPLLVVGALLLMDLALSPFMLVRPHALVWPLLALWTVLLARTAETGRPPPLWAALLLTLWANLHGSFPIAAIVGACLALDALIAAQWKTLREWLVFGGVCLVAVCLNANGLAGILNPFHIARLESLNLIAEWLPSTPSFTPQFYGVLLLVLGLMLWRGVRIPVGRLVLLLGLLALAFTQVRHQSWFAIVAAVVLPPLFAGKPQPLGRVAPLALAAAPLLLIRALWPLTPPETDANPTHLLAAIPPDLRTQAVFNEYTFGGPLILAGIRPYIDGRSELYGDAFMTDYVEIAKGDMARFDRAVARYGIRWAVLPTADKSKLRDELARSPRWRRIYADKVGVIFVRKD